MITFDKSTELLNSAVKANLHTVSGYVKGTETIGNKAKVTYSYFIIYLERKLQIFLLNIIQLVLIHVTNALRKIQMNVPNALVIYTSLKRNVDLAQLVHITVLTINVNNAMLVASLVYLQVTVLQQTNVNVTQELAMTSQSKQKTELVLKKPHVLELTPY